MIIIKGRFIFLHRFILQQLAGEVNGGDGSFQFMSDIMKHGNPELIDFPLSDDNDNKNNKTIKENQQKQDDDHVGADDIPMKAVRKIREEKKQLVVGTLTAVVKAQTIITKTIIEKLFHIHSLRNTIETVKVLAIQTHFERLIDEIIMQGNRNQGVDGFKRILVKLAEQVIHSGIELVMEDLFVTIKHPFCHVDLGIQQRNPNNAHNRCQNDKITSAFFHQLAIS